MEILPGSQEEEILKIKKLTREGPGVQLNFFKLVDSPEEEIHDCGGCPSKELCCF
jgi:hypothetical protein